MTWEPTGFGLDTFKSRHAAHPDETWEQACERVADTVAAAEEGILRPLWRGIFSQLLKDNKLMPGGRIWYGSGRPRGQLLNCFVIPTGDSREAWGKTVSDSIVISGTGGGVGINCSPVRPRGLPVRGTGGTATGSVSLMEVINAAGEVIKAGGGRRTALMLCLSLSHGDIREFLDSKLDLGRLNNANISIVFDEDPDGFFKLVREDGFLSLRHGDREVGTVRASALWDKIVANALKSGEPGILNGFLANRLSNTWYLEPLVSTNPCGEIWMPPYDCCCLGALVLPRFLQNGAFDWEGLREAISASVRFLDNVLSVNHYPLPEIAEKCGRLRRIGLGVTGLHDVLLELGMRYNSVEGLEFVDRLMKFIKNESYLASSSLAAEKGSFPDFNREKFLQSKFVKTLRPKVRRQIEELGMRNCAVNTIAPTGTISIVCGTSSGIEPMFASAYERTYRAGDDLATETVVHPLYQSFLDAGRDVSHFQGAHELSMRDHFEMQRVCQRHVDNAVSKTINVPAGTSAEELSALYMEYLPELKGVTVYPDGSRENQPLRPLTAEELANVGCRSGVCEL